MWEAADFERDTADRFLTQHYALLVWSSFDYELLRGWMSSFLWHWLWKFECMQHVRKKNGKKWKCKKNRETIIF